jgi:aldehyde:ferredoxin oxidoreductase
MWILRINMTDRSYRLEGVPATYKNLGGRGMTSSIVHDEVPPLCHPLGPNNKLVFAPGIGPYLRGSKVPAHRRHQGIQRRLALATKPCLNADKSACGGRST